MSEYVSSARRASAAIGVVATENALTSAELLRERVYRGELSEQDRHDVASLLTAVESVCAPLGPDSTLHRLTLLADLMDRWDSIVDTARPSSAPEAPDAR